MHGDSFKNLVCIQLLMDKIQNIDRPDSSNKRLKIRVLEAKASTRPIGLRFAIMTLRLLEHWRSHLDRDGDSTLIVMATAAITMEKFTRLSFLPEHRDVRQAMPPDCLTKCNVSSIAAATGINRETTRRKVNALVDAGVLLKFDGGSLRLSPVYTRMVPTERMMRSFLETLVQTANDLLREGILETTN